MAFDILKKVSPVFYSEKRYSRIIALFLKDGPKFIATGINRFGYMISWKPAISFAESLAKSRRRGNLGVGALGLGMVALCAAGADLYFKGNKFLDVYKKKNGVPRHAVRHATIDFGKSLGWFLFNLFYTGGFELVKFLVATGWLTCNPAVYATVLITSPWIGPVAGLILAVVTACLIADKLRVKAGSTGGYKDALLADHYGLLCEIITHSLATFGIIIGMVAIVSAATISAPVATMISTGITCGIALFYLVKTLLDEAKDAPLPAVKLVEQGQPGLEGGAGGEGAQAAVVAGEGAVIVPVTGGDEQQQQPQAV